MDVVRVATGLRRTLPSELRSNHPTAPPPRRRRHGLRRSPVRGLTRTRRGDIVAVAGGVYASKPRPALIVQDDRFDATDSLTVCPFTTTDIDAPLLRVPVTADEANGLDQDSFLMVDKITTVRRGNAHGVIGRLAAPTLVEAERRLLVFLGFGV